MTQGKGQGSAYNKFTNGGGHGIGNPVSPILQQRLSHNPTLSNSTKDLGKITQLNKGFKASTNNGPYIPGSGNQMGVLSPKSETGNPKLIPSFLQKNNYLKNSLLVDNPQSDTKHIQEAPSKLNNGNFPNSSPIGDKHPKRAPRMSQHTQMKSSTADFEPNHKVPSFLHERNKEYNPKTIPYPNHSERPQSSKQYMNKSPIAKQSSLSNSYGMMKKSKIQSQIQINTSTGSNSQDPTQQWVKKSWSKKKQKKYSINDFQQIKELGSGKYGNVFLAKEKKSNFICALKIIEKKLLYQEQITQQFIRQLKIQIFLNHPNIIRMYGYFDDAVNIYLILEMGTGGQLFNQLKKLQSMPQPKVAGIIRQVCNAIGELHSYQIIHRDIKPENIVLHENIIKLCDFGWSVYRDKNLRSTFCGTPLYVGPQILKGKQYDQKIDIWSLGVMMYQMLIGQNPFKITKQEELIKIVKDEIVIPNYIQISQEAKSFLFSCLQKNPDQRLSIRQLLNHQFFKKYPEKTDKKMGI